MSGPGRNDPCPCGSGKKYKKCCFQAELDLASTYTKQERDPHHSGDELCVGRTRQPFIER
jgi:hypothetical protein